MDFENMKSFKKFQNVNYLHTGQNQTVAHKMSRVSDSFTCLKAEIYFGFNIE